MQRLVEGGLAVEPAEDSQEQECQGEAHDQQPENVAAGEMAELGREGRLDLGGREPLDERVEEDNALVGAESGEVRVAVARAPRAVHDEEPLGVEAAALDEGLDATAQVAFLERREAVEERGGPARKPQDEPEGEADPREPRVQP